MGSEAPPPHYLDQLLRPMKHILARTDVSDIFINGPGEILVETIDGTMDAVPAPELDQASLLRLARQVAAFSSQGVSRASPLLAASLPDGTRVQVILPPATPEAPVFAFRRHAMQQRSLSSYEEEGAFEDTKTGLESDADAQSLVSLLEKRDFVGLLAQSVRQRRNILVSGGTSSGKTTFLNSLLQEVGSSERMVVIEDTQEVRLSQANHVRLLGVRGQQGEADVSADDLLIASLRLRPDRIILGEIRGVEAFTFLRAVNTGHPGSMTTIHADSPDRAVEQLSLLVLQAGSRLRHEDIVEYITSIIDVYVQLDRQAGKRIVSEVRLAEHLMSAVGGGKSAGG